MLLNLCQTCLRDIGIYQYFYDTLYLMIQRRMSQRSTISTKSDGVRRTKSDGVRSGHSSTGGNAITEHSKTTIPAVTVKTNDSGQIVNAAGLCATVNKK